MSSATPAAGSSTASQSAEKVDTELRNVIQSLYEIAVSTYRNDAPNPAEIVINQVKDLVTKFDHLQTAAQGVNDLWIPREVIGYVEHGRNPDIYTREFVELAIKQNQYLNGKQRAFQDFRDVLAEHINTAFPELRGDVDEVLENTGGRRNVARLPAIASTGESGKSPAGDSAGAPASAASSVPVNGVMKMSISGSGRDEPTPTA
ncbi:RNA polymerase II mediator complex subunit [Orbilia oligospora]|uniref:Mediator of RNA polymerase II transcription subunit 10 n=1 Tax=Orbilia oligospora TaxID=2813651 RepID=A0A7C8RHC8_ORBOL|nr:RNA polymerase II mediator complex subunit [Orbilia oligospora]KAF3308682.1 RNA polymerase II mediator complex subunit [Orbilia oligospora]